MIDLKHILVPLDGSPLAKRALPLAITLAQKHKSQLVLLRAWRLFPPPQAPYRGHFLLLFPLLPGSGTGGL